MRPNSYSFLKSAKTCLPDLRRMAKHVSFAGFAALLFFASGNAIAGDKSPGNINAISFRGAEMYAEKKQPGKITVILKKYFDCGHADVPVQEAVSLFEVGTMVEKAGLQLNKISEDKVRNTYLERAGAADAGCLTVVTYSSELTLGPGRATYDIAWGYRLNKTDIKNPAQTDVDGFVLELHVEEGVGAEENTMASLQSLPPFLMEAGKEKATSITVDNKDNDKVTFHTSAPMLFHARNSESGIPMENPSAASAEGSVLTGRGPHIPMSYTAGLNADKPIPGSVYKVDEQTGEVRYNAADEPGKYLAAITLKETRDKKIIAEHQCVYIIDVLK